MSSHLIIETSFLWSLLFVVGRVGDLVETKPTAVLTISYGRAYGGLGLTDAQNARGSELLGSIPQPVNIVIDKAGSFFVTDMLNWRVLVFSSGGRLSNTISIPRDSVGKLALGYRAALALDSWNRLYVHLTYLNRTVTVNRFQPQGKSVYRFPFSNQKPGSADVTGGLFVSSSGYVYLPTYPAEILRPNWTRSVFKYDTSGRFIGMVDYYVEDKYGIAYKQGLSTKTGANYNWVLEKFAISGKDTASTQSLYKIGVLTVPSELSTSGANMNIENFHFVGLDDSLNTYAANGKVVKVFDPNNRPVRDIPLDVDQLESTLGLVSQSSKITVSPAGHVYIFGLKTPQGKQRSRYSFSEVSFVVLRVD
jgi:hypothetical protein